MSAFHFLLLTCCTINLSVSQEVGNWDYTSSPPIQQGCREREVTSFTLLDDHVYQWTYNYAIQELINRVNERFPCGIRQYTSIKINNPDTTENTFTKANDFINYNYYFSYWNNNNPYYYPFLNCNTSLLHGIKRALEISPAGAFILVLSSGSMTDSNDSDLLREIHNLIDQKRSQIFIIMYGYCQMGYLETGVFNEIATWSYGQFLMVNMDMFLQVIYGFDLFLSQPLNSSLHLLNLNVNVSGMHIEEFNVNKPLTYMLISTNGDFYWNSNFTLFDPNGNHAKCAKIQFYYSGFACLVKSPAFGSWFLNVVGNTSFSVRILGFADSVKIGNCSDSSCDPNASCKEFGGYQECTCKLGFAGDGSFCYDLNECNDYWNHQCHYGYCVNSIGNDSCSCNRGFVYREGLGCVDINECASADLNDCHFVAVCENNFGGYSCSCPYGYFGDGKHCEINECDEGMLCNGNKECRKLFGSYICSDPCSNYTVLDQPWRSINNLHNWDSYHNDYLWVHCDTGLEGWYRFKGVTDQQIPERCVPELSCGSHSPMWIAGVHPTMEEGIVNRTACANWGGSCCLWSSAVSIRACPGGYYVYKLSGTPACHLAYCVEPTSQSLNCSSASCAPDEECEIRNGVSGCHCKPDSQLDNVLHANVLTKNLSPHLVCGTNQISLSYSKCLLERMGFDASTIHLNDYNCRSSIERDGSSMVKINMLPKSGSCGAQLYVNDSHITYRNTIYLSPKSDGVIKRNEALVNFYCSYPKDMEVSLWVAVNPMISSVNFTFGGTGAYSAKMALFQYSDYSTPYEGPEVWLTTDSLLYVGVMVEEAKDSQLVLVMKNCYATPTAESWHPIKYYIIKNNCPNRNDPTISVDHNGGSYQGRFSIQVFKFIGDFDKVYLHCQIRLCDTTFESCYPQCFGMRSLTNDEAATQNLTIGPLRLQGSLQLPESTKIAAVQSSVTATTASVTSLIIMFYFSLKLSLDVWEAKQTVRLIKSRSSSSIFKVQFDHFKKGYWIERLSFLLKNNTMHLFLVLLLPSFGWALPPSNVRSAPEQNIYSEREGTSFTLVRSAYLNPSSYMYPIRRLVNRSYNRFPYVTRQYASIKVNNSAISEDVSTMRSDFLMAVDNYYWDYNYYNGSYCEDSLLHGLRRALEISPVDSFILVLSHGSMSDYNDTALLNDIYNLIDEKKCQIFIIENNYCNTSDLQRNVFNQIASQSFGQYGETKLIEKAIYGLDLLLAKPVNSSIQIFNVKLKLYEERHREEFNVTASFIYLLITTNGKFNFSLVDPRGTNVQFDKVQSYDSGHSYLVKKSVSGRWSIDLIGNGFISMKISGFAGLEIKGNCSDSDCDPNASCEEFGGYQECTCKDGFAGNGLSCYDIDECEDYWIPQCNNGQCINSIGSYSCLCNSGLTYTQEWGCIDIDECKSEDLNDCHELAVCTNLYRSYSCRCPYGYFGDGMYCEVNECEQGNPCDLNKDCTKSNGSYTCTDPCSTYTVLNEPWRSTTNTYNSSYNWNNWVHCDSNLQGWYRFKGQKNQQIPEHCVQENSCGTHDPLWLQGSHPTTKEGIVSRTVCLSRNNICCTWATHISIKACPSGHYVYKLDPAPICDMAYCVEPTFSCFDTDCAPDEECKGVNGVSGCHCKDETEANMALESSSLASSLSLRCELSQIKLSFSKCQLERMGYDTSTIHLRDTSCTSFIERGEKSYSTIVTLPRNGSCGSEFIANETHLTYRNTMYVSQLSNGFPGSEDHVDFYCSYPRNMEVALLTAVNPWVRLCNLTTNGNGIYSVTIGLFQDPSYTTLYEGNEVSLTTESILYVGVVVQETKQSQFVLTLENCYATPTPESWNPVKYYIIKDGCPNLNDQTINVTQNGVSLKGQFSIQVFKFIGNFSKVYLHCEIRLCDTTTESCQPSCSGVKSSPVDEPTTTYNLTLGPILLKAADVLPEPSSVRATAASLATLVLTFYFFSNTLIKF
ncbi:uncharacterized protein O3C94_019060 [Discoglossus pictus]